MSDRYADNKPMRQYLQMTHMARTPVPEADHGPFIEYVPNAEFEFWLQKVTKNIILCFVSCVALMMLCQACPPLQAMLFAFFRWVLIPIKPLLTATPPAAVAGLLALLAPISTTINWLAVPLIALVAIRGQRMSTFLCLDAGKTRLLLVRRYIYNEVAAAETLYDNGASYTVVKSIPLRMLEDNLAIRRPKGKKSVLDYEVVFNSDESDSLIDQKSRLHSVRWGDIIKPQDRKAFLDLLEKVNPKQVDSNLFEPFKQLPDRQSYTALWLKELSGAPQRDKLTPLSEGATLANGSYTVVRKVGVGGQGTVYLAQSPKHPDQEYVILKEFVLPIYPDIRVRKKAAERFQTEAAMLGRLKHPQIARFFDLFVEDHRAYLVLEHVQGSTLKDLIACEGPQQEALVFSLARQIAGILDYLHNQEIPVIHRDLTPDNIMLESGVAKLIDFSVAQEASAGVTGSVVGKPNYIAPEQFRGKPTVQSDIYSLGATMYFLLLGHDPSPITTLYPQKQNEQISDRMNVVVSRCTNLDTTKRYASAAELLADLDREQTPLLLPG